MEYKTYNAVVEYDDKARIFHGEVIDVKDVITFQDETVDELETAFRESVDDYLDFCQARGEKLEKPFSGQFVVRLEPTLHRAIALRAAELGQSLNAFVRSILVHATEDLTGKKSVMGSYAKHSATAKGTEHH